VHTSEVINARIYHIGNNDELIQVVSCEDSGPVSLVEFKKAGFIGMGNYNCSQQFLFKTRLKGSATLSSLKK
jgi:hypothetical protein